MENLSPNSSKNVSAKDKLPARFLEGRALDQDFFSRSSLVVARDLLGKILVVKSRGQWVAGRIVETEAYRKRDPASHAFKKRTARNEIMFGEPGKVYVYFIYGMYEMFNLVTEPAGHPGAVLIRALEPISGIETMKRRRPKIRKNIDLANGPGRLARAMGIKMSHKGETAFGPKISVIDDGYQVKQVSHSPRVGISVGRELFWRYFITGHECLSKAPENLLARKFKKDKEEIS